jgi:hypothetical protein
MFWDSTVFATIVGAFIAGMIGYLLTLFQMRLTRNENRRSSQEEDRGNLQGIRDYLEELRQVLELGKEESCPIHITLPFINQIKFSDCKDSRLSEIRGLYNKLCIKIHAMENFLRIQGTAQELGELGREVVARKHKELRSDILKGLDGLLLKINQFLKISE